MYSTVLGYCEYVQCITDTATCRCICTAQDVCAVVYIYVLNNTEYEQQKLSAGVYVADYVDLRIRCVVE